MVPFFFNGVILGTVLQCYNCWIGTYNYKNNGIHNNDLFGAVVKSNNNESADAFVLDVLILLYFKESRFLTLVCR